MGCLAADKYSKGVKERQHDRIEKQELLET
jgi:hypothetical protein